VWALLQQQQAPSCYSRPAALIGSCLGVRSLCAVPQMPCRGRSRVLLYLLSDVVICLQQLRKMATTVSIAALRVCVRRVGVLL
jgi:hypothetical protein